MTMTDFERKVYEFIKGREHVTYVELANEFGRGDMVICKENDPNIIMGFGMSEELGHAVNNLVNRADIVAVPASIFSFVVDGQLPRMPIAKRPPSGGYKTEHWLPVTYCTYEKGVQDLKKIVENKTTLKEILGDLEAKRRSK
jgi:hypothetical protein